MPVPSAYTEVELKEYMLQRTGGIGALLGLSEDDFEEAVADVLLAYGASDITLATNVDKLRALARVGAWRVAVERTSGMFKFDTGQSSFSRHQVHQQAVEMLTKAEDDAAAYLGTAMAGNVVGRTYVTLAGDPYAPVVEDASGE